MQSLRGDGKVTGETMRDGGFHKTDLPERRIVINAMERKKVWLF